MDLEKGELQFDGCGCGIRSPQPAPRPRRRHRSSSSSSSSACDCVPKPPYPMPPRNCCPSSTSSSSSSACAHYFPTVCPKQEALETVVALDRLFVDMINQGNLAGAMAMARPDATFHAVDEVASPIPLGPLCEETPGTLSQLLPT